MIWLILSAGIWLALLAAALRALITRNRLSEVLPLESQAANAPRVSVIIPARNEASNIERCLHSIQMQAYANFEVIVVDDGSEDGTGEIVREIAAHDGRIHPLAGTPLPTGWKGKPHACWQGAQAATGEWLCFIDADTQAFSLMLNSAVTYAHNHKLDMLSLHPFQLAGTFWERVLIPAGTFFLALTFDATRLEDPADPTAVANGQFILVRWLAYLAADGHRAVRGEILEDVTLARHLKQNGWRVAMRAGSHLIQTRMYTNLGEMWEGLTKNSFDILEGRVDKVAAALLAGLALGIAPTLMPIAALLAIFTGKSDAPIQIALLSGLIVFSVITTQRYLTMRYFRIPALYALTTPLAAGIASAILLNSIWRQRTGRGVTWKGRRYAAANG